MIKDRALDVLVMLFCIVTTIAVLPLAAALEAREHLGKR